MLNRLRIPALFSILAKTRWSLPALAAILTFTALFSNLVTTGQASGLANATDMLSVQDSPYTLYVPYLEQGSTKWCFETAMSMVLGHYGKDASPDDIAAVFGYKPEESVTFFDVLLGKVNRYLSQWQDLSVEHHLFPMTFSRYVKLIDAGTPVIASTFGLPGHTVVVVGYSRGAEGDFLYVHDRSGCYSQLEWGTDSNRFARVKWSEFSRKNWIETVIAPATG